MRDHDHEVSMSPEFWHQRWQRGEIGWHSDEINRHLAEHWPRLGAAVGSRVFVPLCGKSRDLLWLAAQGHRVLGVEISPLAVDGFFADSRLSPLRLDQPPFQRVTADEIELLLGDFFDLAPSHVPGIGAVYDRAALIALPPDMRARYAARLAGLVPSGCPSLLITLDYDQAQMNGPPFAVAESEVQTLFAGGFDIEPLAAVDVLAEQSRFRERGLDRLTEQVYRLRRR
jgi:thiopurine S-methyltransferase